MAFAEGRGVVLSVAQSLRVEHHGPQSTQRAQHLLFEPRCGCHAHPARARAERMAANPHRDVRLICGPGICKAENVWTGFRAATPDKLPLIGPWPHDSTLYLATGHEGLGITTSLATARLLVDQLTGRRSAIPFEPYLPSRAPILEHAHV